MKSKCIILIVTIVQFLLFGCGKSGGGNPGSTTPIPLPPVVEVPFGLSINLETNLPCPNFPPNFNYVIVNANNVNYNVTYEICISVPNSGCLGTFSKCNNEIIKVPKQSSKNAIGCQYINLDHSLQQCFKLIKAEEY